MSRGKCRSIPATGLQENRFLRLDGESWLEAGIPAARAEPASGPDFTGSLLLRPPRQHSCKEREPATSALLAPPPPPSRAAGPPQALGGLHRQAGPRLQARSPALSAAPYPVGSITRGSPTSRHPWPGNRNAQVPRCRLTLHSTSQPRSPPWPFPTPPSLSPNFLKPLPCLPASHLTGSLEPSPTRIPHPTLPALETPESPRAT